VVCGGALPMADEELLSCAGKTVQDRNYINENKRNIVS
jgi:hypothetical protein